MAHVSGESTGNYLLGRNGMWHSGIHITNATTPWCALSGNAITEKASFPVPYKGKQAIRCMADGEIVAYRINQDYLPLGWKNGSLNLSGSFVLVRHYIQPGEIQKSGLHFYTLYMHLAPYSAYKANPTWIVQDKLPTYAPEWKAVAGTQAYKDQHKLDALPKGSIVAWDKKDSQRQLKAANGRLYGLVMIDKLAGTSKLNVGTQCWTLVDNNNILPEIEPSWWKQLASPAKEMMQFDKVVSLTTPIAIKAGDSIGHMGFYQAPKEQGIDSRYQVHIECISADDNLPLFLQNPDKVGHDKPHYLKCLPGLMLWNKQGDDFIKTERVVEWEKTFKLSEIKIEKDKNSNEFYLLPEYLGAIPKIALSELSEIDKQKAQESTLGALDKNKNELGAMGHQEQLIKENIAQYSKFLSQYDLAELGFNALVVNADAFDHLNGYVQPQVEFISSIYERIKAEITGSSVPQKGIIAHNYQRLINKIKSDKKETYSPEEYRRAFHNPMFSHIVNKTIVKHPSDWYYKKSESVWQDFLNKLSEEAPLWRSYSEEFLDSMVWMQDVTNEKIGPEVWHMHPLVFLGQFIQKNIVIGKITGKKFVEYVFEQAKINEKTSKIPAAITTAQAILETGYGEYVPTDINTGKYSFNIFGIKAHGNPDFVEDHTREVINGKSIRIIDKFQAYSSYEESIKGRENFFIKNKRYHFLFNSQDPIEWAEGLQKSGYATDPNYAKELIRVMKSQKLL
ncbi:glycoside hydrolase family 73 protein [Moellerella wisconsensis]|uniref:glycoside hydrolase family 73 protein n=1 Tax=Moellerella wisconsensis TaxID=158849 RepID=UPI0030766B1A